jgi:hypothetical protein
MSMEYDMAKQRQDDILGQARRDGQARQARKARRKAKREARKRKSRKQ